MHLSPPLMLLSQQGREEEREVVLLSEQWIESREKEREADRGQEKRGSNEGSSIRENIRYVPC